jgi:hypothetical protein
VSHPLATLGSVPETAIDPAAAERAFMREVICGMASLRAEAAPPRRDGDLSIPLGLSAWIVRASVDLPDAYDALLRLRRALIEAADLDRATEPVPLRLPDPKAALCSLGSYLYELVGRAARHAGTSPIELADRTLALGLT